MANPCRSYAYKESGVLVRQGLELILSTQRGMQVDEFFRFQSAASLVGGASSDGMLPHGPRHPRTRGLSSPSRSRRLPSRSRRLVIGPRQCCWGCTRTPCSGSSRSGAGKSVSGGAATLNGMTPTECSRRNGIFPRPGIGIAAGNSPWQWSGKW